MIASPRSSRWLGARLAAAFVAVAGAVVPASGELIHRWSFNAAAASAPAGTVFTDTISGQPATIRGVGAALNGTALVLPGTTNGVQTPAAISAYLDLPNGLISSKTHLTLEFWATPLSSKNWQRFFDFGRVVQAGDGLGAPGEITGLGSSTPGTTQASDQLMLPVQRGTTLSTQRLAGRLNGGTEYLVDTSLATTAGTRYHYVVTVADGAGSFGTTGTRAVWYRDGTQRGTVDLPFRLRDLEDVNNWLGRSLWSGDSQAHVAYDEVRFYDHALTPAEITASRIAGPDPVFPAPAAQPDAATLRPGAAVRLSVLANDSGPLARGTVAVVQPPIHGTATPDATGRILYRATTPAPAGVAADSFTYQVSGPGGTAAPAAVQLTFTTGGRLPAPAHAVPLTPPATALQLVEAFPGVSFSQPVALASPPGDTRRLFICEKTGLLRVIADTTVPAPAVTTFLNLPEVLSARGETLRTSSEQGLLGLAFHPAYGTDPARRFFFVFYSARVNANGQVFNRVARFTRSAGDPLVADPASQVILLDQLDQADNHNGGGLAFGPDGYLYVSVGDEGGSDDQYNNGQRLDLDFFAGLLRLDVDKRPGSLAPHPHAAIPTDADVARYAVPPDNPFVGATSFNGLPVAPSAVRTEFWAVGLRNPWRFSFDSVTGELWLADVGQNVWEEINVVTRGGNYGWPYREAAHNGPKIGAAPAAFFDSDLDPLYEYSHGSGTFQGNSVSGGFVYRGSRIPGLTGAYVFGDYVSGHIWALRRPAGGGAPAVERIAGEGGVVAFGPDPANGDVLIADIDNSRLLRLVSATVDGSFPTTLSATGLFADVVTLAPQPGLEPYEVNLPFWSDHAAKQRWFTTPDAARFGWKPEGAWDLPAGTVWVKHFELELTRGDPATRRRLETRLLVKTAAGAYGVSYRWNDAQTEATLVEDGGVEFDLAINDGGTPLTQRWQIPSRAACLVCHTPAAGHALSFVTRQLNRPAAGLLGRAGPALADHQLELLQAAGYLDPATPSPSSLVLPRHLRGDETAYPLEARARSWLAVNCASCHFVGGTAPATWDARAHLSLAQTGLVNGAVTNHGGDLLNRLVVPADPAHSVVLQRMAASGGFTRMPPLATSELDASGIALVQTWIEDLDAAQRIYADWRLEQFLSSTASEGDPAADPDGDALDNWTEFLAGTLPRVSTSVFQPQVSFDGADVVVSFALARDRAFQIETATDVAGPWIRWAVPGNAGLPVTGGVITVRGPVGDDARRFFRVRLLE